MARVDQIEDALRVQLGAVRLQRVRVQGLREDQVESRERRRHCVEVLAGLLDASRELVQDPLDLESLGQLGLAQRVVRFHDLERLDEDRLSTR